jgi:hypothetical protein
MKVARFCMVARFSEPGESAVSFHAAPLEQPMMDR